MFLIVAKLYNVYWWVSCQESLLMDQLMVLQPSSHSVFTILLQTGETEKKVSV